MLKQLKYDLAQNKRLVFAVFFICNFHSLTVLFRHGAQKLSGFLLLIWFLLVPFAFILRCCFKGYLLW